MRFSPVLLAFFTVSATFGLISPVKAQALNAVTTQGTPQTSEPDTQLMPTADATEGSSPAAIASRLPDAAKGTSERWSTEAAIATPLSPSDAADPAAFAPESLVAPDPSAVDLVGQAQPPAGSQTADEDAPAQLQFDISPGPTLQIDTPPPTPATPDVPATPTPTPAQPDTAQPEPRVLVAEVQISGAEGELLDTVYSAITTVPGRTATRSQLQEDINAIFATGFFSNVRVAPEDTPLGVRVTFVVTPNPVLQQVRLSDSTLETLQANGTEVPVQQAVDDIFSSQYNQIINFRDLQDGITSLNQLYQDSGYVLAQVLDSPQVSPEGVVTLQVSEGVIESIQVRFLDEDGNETDEDGNPIDGKTRDFIITREFRSQPGMVFNRDAIQSDLQRTFGLGIFEDVRVSLNPGQDPRKVSVVVNVIERNTGSIAAGLGVSSASGIFGTASFEERNFGGNNQRVRAELQVGERDLLFDVSFTDPWIGGDPYRTSYTVNAFSRRSISLIFDGGDTEIELPNGDRPRVQRIGGGVSFARPLDEWLGWERWRGTLGLQYQNVSIRDGDGEITPRDELGNLLSFSDDGSDDIFSVQLGLSNDRRNNPGLPTSGSLLRFSTEQTIPVGGGSIFFNRLRGSYSYYIPVRFTNFTPGCQLDDPSPEECPQTLAFNVQAGTILGDLPPYEAFSLGGTDSVRGYGSGEVGSGRSFVQATVEYRFPIVSIVGGALFLDFGSDLGTGDDVPGSPAEIRDKPGTGFGYGFGVRVQSPIGQVRVDYGIGDDGDGRIHFGIGERF